MSNDEMYHQHHARDTGNPLANTHMNGRSLAAAEAEAAAAAKVGGLNKRLSNKRYTNREILLEEHDFDDDADDGDNTRHQADKVVKAKAPSSDVKQYLNEYLLELGYNHVMTDHNDKDAYFNAEANESPIIKATKLISNNKNHKNGKNHKQHQSIENGNMLMMMKQAAAIDHQRQRDLFDDADRVDKQMKMRELGSILNGDDSNEFDNLLSESDMVDPKLNDDLAALEATQSNFDEHCGVVVFALLCCLLVLICSLFCNKCFAVFF